MATYSYVKLSLLKGDISSDGDSSEIRAYKLTISLSSIKRSFCSLFTCINFEHNQAYISPNQPKNQFESSSNNFILNFQKQAPENAF